MFAAATPANAAFTTDDIIVSVQCAVASQMGVVGAAGADVFGTAGAAAAASSSQYTVTLAHAAGGSSCAVSPAAAAAAAGSCGMDGLVGGLALMDQLTGFGMAAAAAPEAEVGIGELGSLHVLTVLAEARA